MKTTPKLDRDTLSRCCRKAGLREEKRMLVDGYELFIADGFSSKPYPTFQRFDVAPDEFPHGCYVTFWAVGRGEEHIEFAVPMFFDPYHNPSLPDSARKQARINKAVHDCTMFLKKRKKVRANGV
jgi:hypothetical protein